jgi:hypothetical protein
MKKVLFVGVLPEDSGVDTIDELEHYVESILIERFITIIVTFDQAYSIAARDRPDIIMIIDAGDQNALVTRTMGLLKNDPGNKNAQISLVEVQNMPEGLEFDTESLFTGATEQKVIPFPKRTKNAAPGVSDDLETEVGKVLRPKPPDFRH